MSTADLVVPAIADQVRTARVVAAAAARRAGINEAGLDAIRLAVGEACARATRRASAGDELDITMSDVDGWFEVRVSETAGVGGGLDDDLAATVIQALAPECSQIRIGELLVTRMAWPID